MQGTKKTRIWLKDGSGEINTIKGHCKVRGIAYPRIVSFVRRRAGLLQDADESTFSAAFREPMKIVERPGDWMDIMYSSSRDSDFVLITRANRYLSMRF